MDAITLHDTLRDAIESALMQEAIEDDQVILAQRALVARMTPAEFVELLYVDNKALLKWHEHTVHGHLWTVLALRLQYTYRYRPSTVTARLGLFNAICRALKSTRRRLRAIQELQQDVLAQAVVFFRQVGVPLAKRVHDLRRILSTMKCTSTNRHQVAAAIRNRHQSLLANGKKLYALELAMCRLVDNPKDARRLQRIMMIDNPQATPGLLTGKLLRLHSLRKAIILAEPPPATTAATAEQGSSNAEVEVQARALEAAALDAEAATHGAGVGDDDEQEAEDEEAAAPTPARSWMLAMLDEPSNASGASGMASSELAMQRRRRLLAAVMPNLKSCSTVVEEAQAHREEQRTFHVRMAALYQTRLQVRKLQKGDHAGAAQARSLADRELSKLHLDYDLDGKATVGERLPTAKPTASARASARASTPRRKIILALHPRPAASPWSDLPPLDSSTIVSPAHRHKPLWVYASPPSPSHHAVAVDPSVAAAEAVQTITASAAAGGGSHTDVMHFVNDTGGVGSRSGFRSHLPSRLGSRQHARQPLASSDSVDGALGSHLSPALSPARAAAARAAFQAFQRYPSTSLLVTPSPIFLALPSLLHRPPSRAALARTAGGGVMTGGLSTRSQASASSPSPSASPPASNSNPDQELLDQFAAALDEQRQGMLACPTKAAPLAPAALDDQLYQTSMSSSISRYPRSGLRSPPRQTRPRLGSLDDALTSSSGLSSTDLLNSYGTPLPWTPVRYDYHSRNYVHNVQPVYHSTIAPGASKQLRHVCSLSALVVDSYDSTTIRGR
eukprot:jgi/Chrpa1/144/Chrysochromulina_OHIO_Genome00017284-RA